MERAFVEIAGDGSEREEAMNKPETCAVCSNRRTCNADGVCHMCEQDSAEIEASVIVDENGEEWTPGGYAL